MAVLAEAFGQLPSAVARELDSDPGSDINFVCLKLLRYAEAKRAYEDAKTEKDLEAWRDSELMRQVQRTTATLHRERLAHKQHRTTIDDCHLCQAETTEARARS